MSLYWVPTLLPPGKSKQRGKNPNPTVISDHQVLSHLFCVFEGQGPLTKSVLEMYQHDRKQGTETEVSEHPSPQKDQILLSLASLAESPPCKAEMRNKLWHKLCPQTKSSCCTALRTPSPKLPFWVSPSHLATGEGKAYSNLTPHSTHRLEGLFGGFMNSLHWHFLLNPDYQLLSPNLLITQYFTF